MKELVYNCYFQFSHLLMILHCLYNDNFTKLFTRTIQLQYFSFVLGFSFQSTTISSLYSESIIFLKSFILHHLGFSLGGLLVLIDEFSY